LTKRGPDRQQQRRKSRSGVEAAKCLTGTQNHGMQDEWGKMNKRLLNVVKEDSQIETKEERSKRKNCKRGRSL